MKRFLLLVMLAGCVDGSLPVNPVEPTKPITSTIFAELAANIDADPEFYAYTDDLRAVVLRLRATGKISDAQVAAFDRAVTKERRKLTKSDADAIRGL